MIAMGFCLRVADRGSTVAKQERNASGVAMKTRTILISVAVVCAFLIVSVIVALPPSVQWAFLGIALFIAYYVWRMPRRKSNS
jgi:Flp pilus assembly protein TadB